MNDNLNITFDEENKIRILDPEKFRESEQLKNDSLDFVKKVKALYNKGYCNRRGCLVTQ